MTVSNHQCSKCHEPAIIKQEYSGQYLCHLHFITDFETKAKRTIRKRNWLAPNDSIAIAFSGGSASTALLFFLHKLFGARRDITLCAIHIDEGDVSFRDPKEVISIAKQVDVPCIIRSFEHTYGMADDQHTVSEKKRQLLVDQIAQEYDITRIAYGYHLEDFSRAVLTDIVSGDSSMLLHGNARIDAVHIAPFRMIPEKEVIMYSEMNFQKRYPDTEYGVRDEVAEILDHYAKKHPSVHHAIVNLSDSISNGLSAVSNENTNE